ncbi:peptide chain release factor PrfB3, chloroplastic [Aristolochia californica]|uniref:peptide chain release factor PrfB3, chloroplastic n=1 Tax=Aristolochia californica TaxID=171875 RepID=UPI0035D52FFD
MSIESLWVAKAATLRPKWRVHREATLDPHSQLSCIRASHSMDDKNKFYKELGLFSLRKRIDDAVARAELAASNALEFEEARQIKQEEMVQKYNLWDDLTKSDEILSALASSTKVVDALKDLQYKAEEVKLITELAEMDVINYRFVKQAYSASVDVSKFLDHYEMSKLLSGLYDVEGACVTIRAGSDAADAELWIERLLTMYTKWGKKHGYNWRVIEKCSSKYGGIRSATIEFESKFVYGFLSGERGMHQMITKSLDASVLCQTSCVAGVDVIPIFLEEAPVLTFDDQDLQICLIPPSGKEQHGDGAGPTVSICHVPSGIEVQCSGERNRFANRMKAMNRLKAKLLVAAAQQGLSDVKKLKRSTITDIFNVETRRYIFQPYKLVQDVKTGIQLPDLTSILDGDLEPLIGAHIGIRNSRDSG